MMIQLRPASLHPESKVCSHQKVVICQDICAADGLFYNVLKVTGATRLGSNAVGQWRRFMGKNINLNFQYK